MDKFLVIVESPAKAKTIAKFLGNDFVVSSCMGHIIDLPAKELGVNIAKDFEPTYEVISGKSKLLKDLKKQIRDKSKIYFATDPDREGEAIGWNLKEKLGIDQDKCCRVVFHEITKRAIEEAFRNPLSFNRNKIQAQQARRILDRIVGYFLSPLLWKKVARGLSAGRVQSVALKLIVDREEQINKFIPEEFWNITCELEKLSFKTKSEQITFSARLEKINNKAIQIPNKDRAEQILKQLKDKEFIVKDIRIQNKKKSPPPPFITSTLQQEAFNKLKFSTSKTMFLAQQLYEGIGIGEEGPVGLITYMRTDSNQISDIALNEIRRAIVSKFDKSYLPETSPVYKSNRLAQEAHEAIRPTDIFKFPEAIKSFLSADQFKLYELIWKRAVASQMKPLEYKQILVDIQAGEFLFRTSGAEIVFKGYTIIYDTDNQKEEQNILPPLSIDEKLRVLEIKPSQHFTKPPARYSEGSLVRALEENGIGRPSTYAPIIQTIIARDYVRRAKGYLFPTELGVKVNKLLVEYFPNIIDVDFTAKMEQGLDKIEEGNYNWVSLLREFYEPFKEEVEIAKKVVKKEIIYSDEVCELCGKRLIVKWGRRGKFLSCSDYPKCKFSKSISSGIKCPQQGCNGELIQRRSARGKSFYGCSNYPRCTYTTQKLPQTDS